MTVFTDARSAADHIQKAAEDLNSIDRQLARGFQGEIIPKMTSLGSHSPGRLVRRARIRLMQKHLESIQMQLDIMWD